MGEQIILIGFILFLICFYGSVTLYFKKGLFKSLYHDLMGWHIPDKTVPKQFDGLSLHCICKYCGKEIMQDSQGNWFEA